jgi:hypothetical protein
MRHVCVSFPPRQHALRPSTNMVLQAPDRFFHHLLALEIFAPITICGHQSAAARAYTDTARRLSGDEVAMTIPSDKKGLLNRLFGRRAA